MRTSQKRSHWSDLSLSDPERRIVLMPAKDAKTRRATNRACYHRRKHLLTDVERARRTALKRQRRGAIRAWYLELKSSLVCSRCGEDHPACIQFHHLDPATKEITLAVAAHRGWGRDRILREIEKCEVLCAN